MNALSSLTSKQLEARITRLGRIRSNALVALVMALAEVHRRRLHLESGYAGLTEYCRAVLKEDRRKAWRLAMAAEAVVGYPLAEQLLSSKQISVSALIAVKKALTQENHVELLTDAVGLSEDEARVLASRFRPIPRRSDSIEVVHSLEPAAGCAKSQELVLTERYQLRVTVSADVREQLDAVRAALSHKIPDGNLNDVLAECFRVTLEAYERRRLGAAPKATTRAQHPGSERGEFQSAPAGRGLDLALGAEWSAAQAGTIDVATDAPRLSRAGREQTASSTTMRSTSSDAAPEPDGTAHAELASTSSDDALSLSGTASRPDAHDHRSRHIPVAVRRSVWARDGGCCSFTSADGRRCNSTFQLEFDHWRAFCLGGEHTEENVRVLCSRHNRFEAERALGRRLMRRYFDRVA